MASPASALHCDRPPAVPRARRCLGPRTIGPRRDLLRDERGAATFEAAILLPFMALCWAGLLFFVQAFDATLGAAEETRRAAWSHSNTGCDDATSGATAEPATEVEPNWSAPLCQLPRIGEFVGTVLGDGATVARTRPVKEAPSWMHNRLREGRYSYWVGCNEHKVELGDSLLATMCDQFQSLHDLDLRFAVACPAAKQSARDRCGGTGAAR